MSMSSRLTDAFARIGLEFKSVRSAIEQKYTKPTGGIPVEDLSNGVVEQFTPTWGNLSGVPSAFPAEAHNHTIQQVTGLSNALNAKVGSSTGATINLWVGTVANLPTTRNANTIYLAW